MSVAEKVITLEPCRNQISFNTFDDINHDIINNHLAIFIASIKLIIPCDLLKDKKTNFDLRRNQFNYTIRVTTKQELIPFLILRSFLNITNCKYIEINNKVHKNGFYKDILSLEYHPLSFRQPDDSIREYMIPWFQKQFQEIYYNYNSRIDNIILFGGECVLLGKILSSYSGKQMFYTDFPSIYGDIKRNYRNPWVELINYDQWQIKEYTCLLKHLDKLAIRLCVINTGFKGMGDNLATQINLFKADIIFVISCNETSWNKDWHILQKVYIEKEKIELRTNYSVWIYKLELQEVMHTIQSNTLEALPLDDIVARYME